MSTVLETLSIHELNRRRDDLLKQLKKVDDEITKRSTLRISNLELGDQLKELPVKICKIKIKISKKSNNLSNNLSDKLNII